MKRELRIVGHGNPGFIQAGDKTLNASELTALLNANNIKTTQLKTRIYACYSATPNGASKPSLIQDYATLNQVKTRGFNGEIITRDQQFTPLKGDNHPAISFHFAKPKPHHKNPEKRYLSHTPITAYPAVQGVNIRTEP